MSDDAEVKTPGSLVRTTGPLTITVTAPDADGKGTVTVSGEHVSIRVEADSRFCTVQDVAAILERVAHHLRTEYVALAKGQAAPTKTTGMLS